MDENEFWSIIDEAALEKQDQDKHEKRLFQLLAQQTPKALISFQQHCDHYTERAHNGILWAASLLLNGGYSSDDGFEYFRRWLISRGRAVYHLALNDPDTLADESIKIESNGHPSASFESFSYVAHDVHEELTETEMLQEEPSTEDGYDQPSYEDDFDWQDYSNDVLQKELPRLWKKYGRFKMESDE